MSAESHFGDRLQEYLDKRLDAKVRRVVEAHVDGCIDCRRELEAIAWVEQVIQRFKSIRAPEELRDRVMRAIRIELIDTERLSG